MRIFLEKELHHFDIWFVCRALVGCQNLLLKLTVNTFSPTPPVKKMISLRKEGYGGEQLLGPFLCLCAFSLLFLWPMFSQRDQKGKRGLSGTSARGPGGVTCVPNQELHKCIPRSPDNMIKPSRLEAISLQLCGRKTQFLKIKHEILIFIYNVINSYKVKKKTTERKYCNIPSISSQRSGILIVKKKNTRSDTATFSWTSTYHELSTEFL